MSEVTVFDRVCAIAREHLCIRDARPITRDTRLDEDLSADSLDFIELMMAYEDAFGIRVEDDDYIGLHTIGEFVALIEGKLAAKAGAR